MRNRFFLALMALLICASSCAALAEDIQSNGHIHRTVFHYTSISAYEHETVEFCPTCDDALGMITEPHTFQDGACVFCNEPCPHEGGYTTDLYPIEDTIELIGSTISYDAMRVYICDDCGIIYNSQLTHISEPHEHHTDPVTIHTEPDSENAHLVYKVCSLCGSEYSEPAPHNWEHMSIISYQDEGHTELLRCTECGDTIESEMLPHTPVHQSWKSSTEGHIETVCCADCGYVYDLDMEEHYTRHLTWINCDTRSKGFDIGHQEKVKCLLCGLTYLEEIRPHDIQGTPEHRYCLFCHASDHEHNNSSISYYLIQDDYYHVPYGICTICGDDVEYYREEHDLDPFTLVCTKCGYQADRCLHDATKEYAEDRLDAEGHHYIYTCRKCGKTWEMCTPHNFQPVGLRVDKSTDTAHIELMVCDFCGYEKERSIPHTFEQRSSAEGHWQTCPDCNYSTPLEPHDWSQSIKRKFCRICDYVAFEHHFVFDCYIYSGSLCYVKYRCDDPDCDEIMLDTAEHMIDMDNPAYEQIPENNNLHMKNYHCKNCGYQMQTTQEQHTFENGVCIQCGYIEHIHTYQLVVDETNPHHTWESCSCGNRINETTSKHHFAAAYEFISAQEHRFLYRCDICGFVQSSNTEAHAFDDDTCTRCGYVQGIANDIEFPDAQEPEQDQTPEILSESWYCFTVDGSIVVCIPQVELIEDSGELALILLPASQPQSDERVLTLSREDLRLLCVYQIQQLKLHWNDMDVLLADNLPELYDRIVTESLESFQIKL